MLVSAAIDPYRKSYGNARSRSPMLGGSSVIERMTASPRKTCVPGVHAQACEGSSAIASTAAITVKTPRFVIPSPSLLSSRAERGTCTFSDAELLPLASQCLAHRPQLRLHHVFHGVAC